MIHDHNPVRLNPVGNELSKTVYWQGRQWSVTEDGLEKRDGTYHILPAQLPETWKGRPDLPGKLRHMVGKNWLDVPDFYTAFVIALALHGHGDVFAPDILREMGTWMLAEREHNEAMAVKNKAAAETSPPVLPDDATEGERAKALLAYERRPGGLMGEYIIEDGPALPASHQEGTP